MHGDVLDDLPDAVRIVLGEAREQLPEYLTRELESRLDQNTLNRSDYITTREMLPARWRRLFDRMVHGGDDAD